MLTRFLQKLHPRLPRVFRILLWKAYGFDRWHTSVFAERAYAKRLTDHLNARDPAGRGSLVEIGCGLGDIVRRARYRRRVGLDRDPNALRAARLLARLRGQRGIEFTEFVFPDSQLSGRYDVIVMVNWIHGAEPAVLKSVLDEFFHTNLCDSGEILVDTVQDPVYDFNHSIEHLTEALPCTVKKLGDFEHGRALYAIRKVDQRPSNGDGSTAVASA